jgi:hypothetical protein
LSAPVEKSGPDFHRLAVPTRSKSPIRSVPKSGSGAVTLEASRVDSYMSRVCVTCTELVRLTRSNLLPGGDCNKGLWEPQGLMRMDEVIRAVSWIEKPRSGTLPRFHSAPGKQGIPPSSEPISPRSATAGGCTAFFAACPQRAASDWSQTAVARGATA